MTRQTGLRRSGTAADGGFTLLETIIAMMVFAIFVVTTVGILTRSAGVTRDNIQRTAATNLATRAIEAARSSDALDIPDGRTTDTRTVGGTTYTITQTASYVTTGATASICSGSGNTLAYKLVTVKVTWPAMGSTKPVRADTLRAVGVGTDGIDASLGTLAVSVLGSTGQATPDVAVTLSPGGQTRTTGDDGCAVFAGIAPGSYTASSSVAGYVGTANVQTASVASLGVVASEVRRGSLLYDTQRSVNVLFDAPTGAVIPSNLSLQAGDSYQPEAALPTCATSSPTSACTTGVPGTVRSLFPETYTLKAGSCTQTTPSSTSVDLRPAAADGSTVTVPVGAVTVTTAMTATPAVGVAGRTVTVSPNSPSGTGCSGEIYTTTSTAPGSQLVLPYGTWQLSTPVTVMGVPQATQTTQTVTVSPTNKTPSVTLLVGT